MGTAITMDSEYDSAMFLLEFGRIVSLMSANTPAELIVDLDIFYLGVLCHYTDQVIYGMEKRIF